MIKKLIIKYIILEKRDCFFLFILSKIYFRQKRAFEQFFSEIVSPRNANPPHSPSPPFPQRDEWVFKGQVRKQSRPNMAASSTTGFLGIVFGPRTGNQQRVYIYIYIHIYTHSTDFVPPLCISARLCLALLGGEEAACNANSRYNCRPVHREADLDSSVSRTCQLGVTTPGIVPTFALFAPPFLSTDFTIRDIEIPIQFIQPIPPNRFYYQ